MPVFAILIGLGTRDRADRQWRQLAALSGHFLDVVRGLPTLVAHRRATRAAARRSAGSPSATAGRPWTRCGSPSPPPRCWSWSPRCRWPWSRSCVGLRLAAGTLDFRTALIVLLLAPEAYWPLRRMGAEFHAAAEGTAAFETAIEILDDQPAVDRCTAAGRRRRSR